MSAPSEAMAASSVLARGAAVAPPGLASYFDGHFAITPLGCTLKPSGESVPLSTTSASLLNVSGTTPV